MTDKMKMGLRVLKLINKIENLSDVLEVDTLKTSSKGIAIRVMVKLEHRKGKLFPTQMNPTEYIVLLERYLGYKPLARWTGIGSSVNFLLDCILHDEDVKIFKLLDDEQLELLLRLR